MDILRNRGILCVCIVLAVFVLDVGSQDGTVRILGINSAQKVQNDFLVVFKLNETNCKEQLDDFVMKMKDKVKSAKEVHRYKMGNFVAMRYIVGETDVEKLADNPHVKFIEANQKVHLFQNEACISQNTGSTAWGLSRIASKEKPIYTKAKYEYLNADGADVDVYVVDTGIYVGHEEFQGRAVEAYVSSSLAKKGGTPKDENGHGTHVSGIIGGKTYGVCKKANLYSVRVLDKNGVGTTADVLEGLSWVHNDYVSKKGKKGRKAKGVVNMSLGGMPGVIDTLDEAAIVLATEDGLPFSIAAGNDNADACLVSPARLAAAITVGATDVNDIMTTYSNYGPCVDILAPGDKIRSAYIGTPTASAIISGSYEQSTIMA